MESFFLLLFIETLLLFQAEACNGSGKIIIFNPFEFATTFKLN